MSTLSVGRQGMLGVKPSSKERFLQQQQKYCTFGEMPKFCPFLITMLNGGASIREENEMAQDMEDPGSRKGCTVKHCTAE